MPAPRPPARPPQPPSAATTAEILLAASLLGGSAFAHAVFPLSADLTGSNCLRTKHNTAVAAGAAMNGLSLHGCMVLYRGPEFDTALNIRANLPNKKTSLSHRDRHLSTPLIKFLATFGHPIEEDTGLAVDEVDISRKHAARRCVSRDRSRTDGHHLHVTDTLGSFLRLPLGIEQVFGAEQDQRLRLDRLQGFGRIAIETRRGANFVTIVGPSLIDPVVGVEGLEQITFLLL